MVFSCYAVCQGRTAVPDDRDDQYYSYDSGGRNLFVEGSTMDWNKGLGCIFTGIYLFLSDDCSELLSDSLDFDLAGMELFREKCTSGSLWNIAWFVSSG